MIKFSSEYLNFKDTLECGQVFRFCEYERGYLVFSRDKCAYVYNDGEKAIIDGDDYFYEYFDLIRDYGGICAAARSFGIKKLDDAVAKHCGLRILRQDKFEALVSFIVSQNNNIPRIKSIIERLCRAFGERRCSPFGEYYSFPTVKALADAPVDELKALGLGYRDAFVSGAAKAVSDGELDLEKLSALDTVSLRKELLKIKGVGNKVADCALLFGFGHTDAFPVDTWIEKLYREDFQGTLTDRTKISEYFVSLFKENSGYIQQYLFYAKREGEM